MNKKNILCFFIAAQSRLRSLFCLIAAVSALSCGPIIVIGMVVDHKITLNEFFTISLYCILFNILGIIIAFIIDLISSKNFLHKMYLLKSIFLGVIHSVNCLYVLYFYFYYMEFKDFRLYIFVAHLIFIIIFVFSYMYKFIDKEKEILKLYYIIKNGVFFLDSKTIIKISENGCPDFILSNYTIMITLPLFYSAMLLYMYKVYSKYFREIFFISFFTCLLVLGIIYILMSIYRLTIINKIKHETGINVYSDSHDTLKDDPQKAEAFFALHAKPIEKDGTTPAGGSSGLKKRECLPKDIYHL
jgi:hypothetical protein